MRALAPPWPVLLCVVAATAGCDDPLREAQTISGLRVLAARAEAIDEPERASLRAGEPARLRFLVASDHRERFAAALALCRAQATTSGLPRCAQDAFFEATHEGDTAQDLVFSFSLPEDFPEAEPWLARLVICRDGDPELLGDSSGRCEEGGGAAAKPPLEAVFRAVPDAEATNRNPDLGDDELRFEGRRWEASEGPEPGAACDPGGALPEARAGTDTTILFSLEGDDREALPVAPDERYAHAPSEALLFAHFATLPGLDRPFSVIEAQAQEPAFELTLSLDKDLEAPASGVVVDFYLVVRDPRQGVDWLRRKLCARTR